MVKFSVVCPVYNSASFILDTLTNIVEQSYPPDELILVDDGSSDNTCDIINQFVSSYTGPVKMKIIESQHAGPGAARNTGILACRNPWIAFMDSDDCWENEKLKTVAAYIDNNPDKNIFCHNEMFIRIGSTPLELNYAGNYKHDRPLTTQLYIRNLFSPSATVCHIDLFRQKGYFNEQLSSSQDYELWLRLAPMARPCFIPEPLGYYHERSGSISSKKAVKRLKNQVSIEYRYRNYVSLPVYFIRLLKTVARFGIRLFK